jgi:hypothetical protein
MSASASEIFSTKANGTRKNNRSHKYGTAMTAVRPLKPSRFKSSTDQR